LKKVYYSKENNKRPSRFVRRENKLHCEGPEHCMELFMPQAGESEKKGIS